MTTPPFPDDRHDPAADPDDRHTAARLHAAFAPVTLTTPAPVRAVPARPYRRLAGGWRPAVLAAAAVTAVVAVTATVVGAPPGTTPAAWSATPAGASTADEAGVRTVCAVPAPDDHAGERRGERAGPGAPAEVPPSGLPAERRPGARPDAGGRPLPVDPSGVPEERRPPVDPSGVPEERRRPVDPSGVPEERRRPVDPSGVPDELRPPVDPSGVPQELRPPVDPSGVPGRRVEPSGATERPVRPGRPGEPAGVPEPPAAPRVPAALPPLAVLDVRGDGAVAVFADGSWVVDCILVRRDGRWERLGLSLGPVRRVPVTGVAVQWLGATTFPDGTAISYLAGDAAPGVAAARLLIPGREPIVASVSRGHLAAWWPAGADTRTGRLVALDAAGRQVAETPLGPLLDGKGRR